MGKLYKVAEIFGPTIQGEGTHVGEKVSFVRFAGCNLRCPFCDTDHTPTLILTAQEILEMIPENTQTVVLSGGEPLLQLDEDLVELLNERYLTHLETNGTKLLNGLHFDHITVSPKAGVLDTVIERVDNLKLLFPAYNPDDWEYVDANKFLQPLETKDGMAIKETLAEVYKREGWKISVQLHKILGVQ